MTSQTEREVLEALFTKLHDGKSARWLDYYGEPGLSAKGRRFNALMGLNAYLDAALMLVPEGWLLHNLAETPEIVKEEHTGWEPLPEWSATLLRQDCAGYRNRRRFMEAFAHGDGDTPALAIYAAIEAAIAQNGE